MTKKNITEALQENVFYFLIISERWWPDFTRLHSIQGQVYRGKTTSGHFYRHFVWI